ncbi:MAG: dTDP-glucose 4,6-dehydratase [Nitrososphaerota archaeon]|jgi:dTDP-glucose 4,6-dehydratase|nr:dTDP-glucose 4,6-dehydratase [Nitrososphaerota archaeon]MDG6951700.1 dTDP-glucose 4,6-dehydratase [Nitrososphaerota archaeon]MDG6980835.1 dTDP-glucose 4,6-dehydratase [Nitrososphaerota archaeon]MDG6990880.1 dTDP-glucose 4,6-dehydratase [Nitrososphaerota archaeon]
MRLLVTGGLGFIGSNFIAGALRREDVDKVVNIDNLSFGANRMSLKQYERHPTYNFVRGDINDTRLLCRYLDETDVMLNFAAETHVDRSISDPRDFVRSNVLGVYSILESLRKAKDDVKLIHVGTDEEYGDIVHGSFKEEDRLIPSSPYAASKAAASMLIRAYHRTYGLKAIITRCTNNFGPHQSPEKLVPKTIIRAGFGLKIPLYGKGRNIRDWVYVKDHCEAIDAVLRKGKSGQVYNISSGVELENFEVVSAILELLGKPLSLIEHVEDRPGHDLRYSLDSSKIRNQLSWKPKHSFRRALAKTVEWYLKNENWWKPLTDERVLHPTPWKLSW